MGSSAIDSGRLDPLELLAEWLTGVKLAHVGHARAAAIYARRATALGVGATIVSAAVGTTLFATLAASTDDRLIGAAALLSVIAVILSALQTFLNYGELAVSHRVAAGAYGDLRRRVEQLLAFGRHDKLQRVMAEITEAWAKLDRDSPDLSPAMFDYARKWVSKRTASS